MIWANNKITSAKLEDIVKFYETSGIQIVYKDMNRFYGIYKINKNVVYIDKPDSDDSDKAYLLLVMYYYLEYAEGEDIKLSKTSGPRTKGEIFADIIFAKNKVVAPVLGIK